MKYRCIIILILVFNLQLSATIGDVIYSEDEIDVKEVVYSRVDYTNALKIWQIELGHNQLYVKAVEKTLKKQLKADVYMPPQTIKPRGFVMLMFGSAFLPSHKRKSKKSIKLLCTRLAREGYVTASVDYRLMNPLTPSFAKAGYIATQDAKCALQYFANNHKRFNIDPSNFFVGGISAGAFTAINAAFLDNGESLLNREKKFGQMFGGLCNTCPIAQVRYNIRGVISISGAVYDLNILDSSIPIISFHGNYDLVVPYEKALPFTPLMEKYNSTLNMFSIGLDPRSRRKLQEAKMFPVYGSKSIHAYLKNSNKYYFEYDGYGHKLLLTRTTKQPTEISSAILKEISGFLDSHKSEGRIKELTHFIRGFFDK